MMDIGGDLAVEAAKELVKAIVTGMVDLVKKIPVLWRHTGRTQQEQVAGQLARSTSELADSSRQGSELEHVLIRHEGAWEALIRSLLAETPEARHELRELVALIDRQGRDVGQSVSQRNVARDYGTVYAVQGGSQTIYRDSPSATAEGPDQTGSGIGRSEYHSEMLAERLVAAEARVAELEQQLDDTTSQRREAAAHIRLIVCFRTSFGKVKLRYGYSHISTTGDDDVGYCFLEINHYVAQLRNAVYRYFSELDGQSSSRLSSGFR